MTSDANANANANARLAEFGLGFSHPLQLLLNFSLFQYLVTVYFARRREPRVAVLFLTGALGFMTLMPFATANKRRVASLHDISEVCCYLTFLQQITILTRDVNRKLKLRSLSWFMWTAELLILASFAIIAINVVQVADPRVHMEATVQLLDMVVETVSLWFIVAFRFYFLAMIRGGWRSLWRSHRYEVFFYVLFMTHGYPFVLLEHSTGLDWGSVEGAYNRLTIALCLSSSIRARLVSEASLLINFSLFQYLLTIYYRRRREHRVRLLLLVAATGFLTLMPFAIDDKARVASLHDISEVCCYLTFLQQITILTRDVNRKLKLRSLKLFMWGAEPRVRLLLLVAITGFATLMPFAIEDKKRVHSLHDISEVCSSLTFLQQITILTRDINRKLKLHSLKWWMWLAETLILASIVVIMINVVEIGFPSLHLHIAARADIVIENVSLCFIVAFRFYFLGMIRSGWRTLWRFHRVEVCFYLLFMTHEYPFIMLKHFTGLNWESVQGAYNRLTIPLQLLINFSLFQYLLTVYYSRRREPRVRLLLLTGIIGFATLIPFAIDDKDRVASLHDISEVCSYLTFLQQITILTRDVNRKLKLRSLLLCMGLSEMLTLASIIVIILNIVEIAFPAADLQAIAYVDKVIEKVSLWFVAVFRFYFLAMFRGGWRGVWSFHRDELFYYLLLVMHEIPFIVLEHYFPTLQFEYVQGANNRLTIVLSPAMAPTAPTVDTGQPPGVGPPISAPDDAVASSRVNPHAPSEAPATVPVGTAAAAEFVTPTTNDVFAATEPSHSATSPRSRRYDECGDAEMDGDAAPAAPTKIDSSLQTRLAGTPPDGPAIATPKEAPQPTAPAVEPTKPSSQANDADATAPRRRHRRGPRRSAAPSGPETPATTHPVWSPQGAAYIRATLSQAGAAPTHAPAVPELDNPYRANYDCALREASLRRDGDQRALTSLERTTLHLWIERKIHLATPPLFLRETHTGPERDAFADYHRDHLGFRLYVVLPVGIVLSEVNAKYDFCFTALLSAKTQSEHDRLLQLYRDAQTTLCEPRSRIATLRFVTPDLRDSWNGFSFYFGKEKVTLTATDSLTSDAPRAGFDAGAQQLLYHVFLRGDHRLSHRDVRAIGSAAAGKPVLDVALVESFAASDYSPPKWKLTFDQISCPPALERMRRLNVTYGGAELTFLVIHPRATRRSPCTRCLSVRHAPKDCDTKDPAKYLARHSLSVRIERARPLPKITATPPSGTVADLLGALRLQAAPEVASRLEAEARDQQAAAERKTKRAATASQRQAQLQQARRKLAQQARAAVAKQLQALRHEYRPDAAPQTPAQVATTPAPSDPESSRACHQPSAPDRSPVQEEPLFSAGPADTADEAMADADASPVAPQSTSTAPAARGAQVTVSGAPAGTPADSALVHISASNSAPTTQVDEAGLFPSSLPSASTSASVPAPCPTSMTTLVANGSDQARSSIADDPPTSALRQLAAPATQHLESYSATPSRPHRQTTLAVQEPRHLALVTAPGKRRTGPVSTSSDEEAGIGHVPKWWRVTTRADAAHAAAKSMIPVIASPLFPNSWSPISCATPLAITGPELPASAGDQADETAGDDKPSRPLKQLALSAFYAPRSLAEAQAMLESELLSQRTQPSPDWPSVFPSPELDNLLAVLRTPTTLTAWLHALGARVVATPGTGGCLYFALHGARTRRLAGATMSICNFHVKEGKYYKDGVCSMLDTYLEPMLDTGAIAVTDFQRRFVERLPDDRAEAVILIRQYIDWVRSTPITKMSTRQWGGDEELYAAVWFIREPIFVIGVDQDSHASVRVIWLDRPNPSEREEIYHHLPAPDEAFELFRAFLHHRVTPVVLVHADSHFNCLRFNERFYKDWTADDVSGAKMRDRLDQVLGQLGWYVAPTAAFSTSVTPPQVQPQPSGSLFVPSETSADEPEPPVSDEPLSPISHYALLSALNPRRRRRGPFALLWRHAERLNSAAYTQWNAAQVIPAPTIEPTDLQRACRDWSAQPAALLALLRALPYPEVAVSLLPADVVLRLGNELTALSADRGVPAFVHADDPADAGHLWAKLVVLVTVAADPDSGRALTAADLGPMDGAASPLSDLLEIQRLSPTMLRFRLRKVSYPYLAVNGFRLLCDTLVICYPDLLLDDLDPDRIRELGQSSDSWFIQRSDTGPHLIQMTATGCRTDLGVVLSHRHAERLARSASGRPRLNLAPHPSTCPTPPLWGTLACFSKRRLRIAVTTPRRERAQQHLKTRTTGLRTSAPLLGAALDQVPLGAAHSLPHSSSRQRLAFYRLPKGKAAPEDPYSTIHLVWQQLVLETIVTILAWRRASDDPDDAWSERRACATHTAMCQQVLRTLSYRLANSRTADPLASRLVDTIRELAIEHPPSEPAPPTPSATSPRLRHVLFFDGGSRGNPGRGGAGAFIVQYAVSTATPTVVWSAAMSLAAPTTTNNQAEYHGLLTGLRAAHAHDWHNLDVVGDSALIIRQMSRQPQQKFRPLQLKTSSRPHELAPMPPTVDAEGLAFFNAAVGQPLKLLLNFSLFQYLLTVYFARRREPRVALLLLVAITGFVTLMPFAIEDKRRVASLHDISEVCCFLSFLQQITILTRDIKRKLKLRPIIWSMWIAEVLILAGVGIIVLNVVEIAAPSLEMHVAKKADLILEKIALCFITAFRFFFLAMIRGGWRPLWRSHRFELVSYLLFLTHELPFLALEHYTDLDWQSVQGTYNRVTIALCLSFSIRARFSSEASAQRRTTTNDPGRDSYWPVALPPSKAGTIVPQT
ncbi:hypothetical protein P43SY_009480 [Pythium insidiosum]|uniref:RNase H type-1 domain-containing protein n=1 Tax=Pythium insidiosum TaxID=114742 RepID=A0AAD5Q3V1_PYTIN|nr:hypothetical protein P43SY_009480 [Pythium insidiosum]